MANVATVDSIDPAELARCLFEESNDALFVFDPHDLRLIDVNPTGQKLTRLTRRRLLDLTLPALFEAESPALLKDFVESCQETCLFHSREAYRLLRGDGEPLDVNVTVSRLHTKPNLLGLIAVRDISERRMMEAELRDSQAKLRWSLDDRTAHLEKVVQELRASELSLARAQEIAQIGSWEFDVATMKTSGSATLRRILGIADDEQEQSFDSFLSQYTHPDDQALLEATLLETLSLGQTRPLEFRILRPPEMEERYVRVQSEFDGQYKVVGTLQDITERVRAAEELQARERELAHVSRLSTMGEMVAGIAHEINQPLSAISNFASAARQVIGQAACDFDAPVDDWLSEICRQADRCGDIIRRLRQFTRKEAAVRTDVDVHQIIQDSIAILSGVLRENNVDVDIQIPNPGPSVLASEAELQQVFVNLLRNACDATIDGQVAKPTIRVGSHVNAETMTIIVCDNGPGVSKHATDNLFDPFFTTRNDGMGMGLAISRSIIEDHGGRLWLDENSSVGAHFHIQFPLQQGEGSKDGHAE